MSSDIFGKSLSKISRIDGFDFSEFTTYGIGGKCQAAFLPKTYRETENLFSFLMDYGKKFIVLGSGSNVLVSDSFFDGYCILTSNLSEIRFKGGSKISCGSGTTVRSLTKFCLENGLSGFEFMCGIPASVGGAVYMNAAAGSRSMSGIVDSVLFFDGKQRVFDNSECNFGNKYSTMRDINCIIESVDLNLKIETRQNIIKRIKSFVKLRKSQPTQKSCGCIFKNPDGKSAGKIIDSCGLKGLRIGGAAVSEKHANFIVNDGATANEIFSLIQLVKRLVFERTGVLLEEEVCYIGDFYETDC